MFDLNLLRYKNHGTDQDPLCEQQQLDFIFVVVLNTSGMHFTKDFHLEVNFHAHYSYLNQILHHEVIRTKVFFLSDFIYIF